MTTKMQSPSKKVRKGDKVLVIAGNYRGQTGTVLERNADRVVIQGINMRKKHTKRTQQNPTGAIVAIEKPINVSNVQVCLSDDKPVKLKMSVDKQGKRSLTYVDNGREVTYRPIKKPVS
jgi:large subunit ribosomal protein L24